MQLPLFLEGELEEARQLRTPQTSPKKIKVLKLIDATTMVLSVHEQFVLLRGVGKNAHSAIGRKDVWIFSFMPTYCLVGWLDRDTFTHDGGASERFA